MTRLGGTWRPGGIPRNVALSGIRTIVRFVSSFALLPFLIDGLGDARTGLFLFATTLTGYFTAIELGVGTGVTRYVAQYRTRGEEEHLASLLRASLALMVGMGAVIGAVLATVGIGLAPTLFDEPGLKDEVTVTLLAAALTALLYWPSRLGVAALNGLERYDQGAVVGIVTSVLKIVILAVMAGAGASVAVLVLVFGALSTLEGVVAGVLAWPHLPLRRRLGRWRSGQLRGVAGFGGAVFVIGLSSTVQYALDRAVVAGFAGAAAVVTYEIAARPQAGIRTLSSLLGTSFLSPVSRLVASGRVDRMRTLVLVGSLFTVLVTAPVTVLVMVLAEPLIALWVGDQYREYAYYVQIFTSMFLIGCNVGALSSAVMGLGRMRTFVNLTIATAATNLTLSILLTARYGAVGVILGTVITSYVQVPVWMRFALRHVDIKPREYLRAVALPAYGLLAVWAAPVAASALVLKPEGLVELAAFAIVALGVFAAMALPIARTRWRAAVAGEPLPGVLGTKRLSILEVDRAAQ